MSITVNICSYRYGHLVAHAVESALSQTKKPDVVRVYDDGIGDCKHIEWLYPEVELIERGSNWGTVRNFQDALVRTKTDRVMFLGADNYLRPDTLEILDKHHEDIISYNVALFGTEIEPFIKRVGSKTVSFGYPIWEIPKRARNDIKNVNFLHGSSLYNVQKAKKIGYTGHKGRADTQEDWHLFKGMLLELGCSYRQLDDVLLFYRRHKENNNPV